MDELSITKSTARFPFKKRKTKKGMSFRQTIKQPDSMEGAALDIEHKGHDHLSLVFRELYETKSGRQGDKCLYRWTMDTKATVQMASVLFLLAEHCMRDSAEVPYSMIVDKERAEFGVNWINEDYATAVARTEKRKERSHLFGLMKRCIETCDDDEFIKFLLVNLTVWAEQAGDAFASSQAEKALFQLKLVPSDELN